MPVFADLGLSESMYFLERIHGLVVSGVMSGGKTAKTRFDMKKTMQKAWYEIGRASCRERV